MSDHPALWFLKQLFDSRVPQDWFINVRCIHNKAPVIVDGKPLHETECSLNLDVPISQLHETWYKNLGNLLIQNNTHPQRPANNYFAVNPRPTKNANKLSDVPLYFAFYLDCDNNKSYTKEERLHQFNFWKLYGLEPSIVVDSGSGYHVYWLLETPIAADEGRPILKRMVALSGCRDKGNTFDQTRVLRLPGFLNQKNWSNGASPLCHIIFPEQGAPVKLYKAEQFMAFPPSEKADVEQWYAKAYEMGATSPEQAEEAITKMARAAAQAAIDQGAITAGQAMHQTMQQRLATADAFSEKLTPIKAEASPPTKPMPEMFTPNLTAMPALEYLKFDNKTRWMPKYIRKGWYGLSEDEMSRISELYDGQTFSASELDAKVMWRFIYLGYTKEAILEFWNSPQYKLFRPDKMQKNANYLNDTYENQLKAVQSYIAQGARAKDKLNEFRAAQDRIFVQYGETFHRDAKGNPDLILSGELVLLNRFYDLDARNEQDAEWFEVRAYTTVNGNSEQRDMMLPGEAFNSIQKFKQYACRDNLRCFTSDVNVLSRLQYYLECKFSMVPRHKFHSRIRYTAKQFFFPYYTVTADGIHVRSDSSVASYLAERFPAYKDMAKKFWNEQKAKNFIETKWIHVIHSHLPRLVMSVMGTIASSAIKQIFEEDLGVTNFHLPTINIRGKSHSGKTYSTLHLLKFTGQKKVTSVSVDITQFALYTILNSNEIAPSVFDEFREIDDKRGHSQMENLRSCSRRCYTGEEFIRGRQDQGLNRYVVHKALIIIGESPLERAGDTAGISRMFPCDTDEYDTDTNTAHWGQICNVDLHLFAPWFYSHLLRMNHEKLREDFIKLEEEVLAKITRSFGGEKQRVAHNLATLIFGCRLWDDAITAMVPSAPRILDQLSADKFLIEYMHEWAKESGQTLVCSTPDGKEQIVNNNEFFEMLKTVNNHLDMMSPEVQRFGEGFFLHSAKHGELRLRLDCYYRMYQEIRKAEGRSAPDIVRMRQVIKNALRKNQPWVIAADKLVKHEGRVMRCVILNIAEIERMGLIQPGRFGSKPDEKSPPFFDVNLPSNPVENPT